MKKFAFLTVLLTPSLASAEIYIDQDVKSFVKEWTRPGTFQNLYKHRRAFENTVLGDWLHRPNAHELLTNYLNNRKTRPLIVSHHEIRERMREIRIVEILLGIPTSGRKY